MSAGKKTRDNDVSHDGLERNDDNVGGANGDKDLPVLDSPKQIATPDINVMVQLMREMQSSINRLSDQVADDLEGK